MLYQFVESEKVFLDVESARFGIFFKRVSCMNARMDNFKSIAMIRKSYRKNGGYIQ